MNCANKLSLVLSAAPILSKLPSNSRRSGTAVNLSCLPSHSRPKSDWSSFFYLFVTAIHDFDYAFAENGLTAFKLGQPLPSQSFISYVGEDRYKTLVNFILHYIADLDIPIKRQVFFHQKLCHNAELSTSSSGTFVEFRRGMVNVSPIGRNATSVVWLITRRNN